MAETFVYLVLAILLGIAVGSPLIPKPHPKPHWPTHPHLPIPPGTDLGLYNEGFVEGDIVPHPTIKNAVIEESMLWPMATIVYKTKDGVGCPTSPQCEILMKAMEHYHQRSCIRFKEWTGERDYVNIFFNPDNGACWSPVGRSGGEQLLSLGQRCWYPGIVVHELGHAVGFWHEMNRPDRDSYIRIFWNNIIPGFAGAFTMHGQGTVDTLQEKFDYKSIMMYDEYAFSKDGSSPTIQPKQSGVTIGPIWKKPGLSTVDLRRIQKLYKCEGSKPKRGFPYDINCSFNYHTCGFKNGGNAVWNWRNSSKTESYVYSTCETAGSTPGYFLSVNLHPSQDSNRGCVRFWYLLRSDKELALQLSQVYLDSATQITYDPELARDLWETQESTGTWVHADIPIDTSRPFKLIFMSAFSDRCRRGTIALDDVRIQYRPCHGSLGAPGEATDSISKPEPPLPLTTTEAQPLPPHPAITQPRPPPPASPEANPDVDWLDLPNHPQHPPAFPEDDYLMSNNNEV